MSKTCECKKTNRQKAQEAVNESLKDYNDMMEELRTCNHNDLSYVPKSIKGLLAIVSKLIDAIGCLAYEEPKTTRKRKK